MRRPGKLTPAEAVGKRMGDLRKMHGITLYRISKSTGVPYSTIKSYEQRAASDIQLGTLISLADFFGMSLSEFTNCEYFDFVDGDGTVRHKHVKNEDELKDFRELREKSEEWALWNNSKWWSREEL